MCPGRIQLVLLLFVFPVARADTVKLANKPAFRNVSITDFRGGRLVFRGVARQYLHKPLEDVEWLAIDGQPELNAAEQAATGGAWSTAVTDYEHVLAGVSQPWLRDLIRLRLLWAARKAGCFDRAVGLYTDLAALGTLPPARYRPAEPGPMGSDLNQRARTTLEGALAGNLPPTTAEPLRTLLLELLLYEDVDPLPDGLIPAGVTSRSQPATRPLHSRPVGILPTAPDESEPQPAGGAVPSPKLPADSFVLLAAATAADEGDYARAARLLERANPYVAACDRAPWRLLLGRCQIELGRHAAAAADLLNLAETDADPARAAQALYYVALAHERMGRSDVARRLYEQVQQRADAPEKLKTQARIALERLQPAR